MSEIRKMNYKEKEIKFMRKNVKKFLSLLLITVLCFGGSMNVFAADTDVQYEEIFNQINDEYDLDLGYEPVDTEKVTLSEYEEFIREFAAQQRELLDYIESKETCEDSSLNAVSRANVVKTKTKDTWNFGNTFSITATYTVYDGQKISLCRNAVLNQKNQGAHLTNISGPTYSLIDSARTSTVKYTATIHTDVATVSNGTLYTEFYYSE